MEAAKQPSNGERFFEKGFETVHAAAFFIDEGRRRIGIFKRAANVPFAANLYTGIGGKIEKDETHIEGIIREITEETQSGPIDTSQLKELGRIIVNGRGIVCYFGIPYSSDQLPDANPKDGQLQWVSFDQLPQVELIPTARHFVQEWSRRGIDPNPFTIQFRRADFNDIHSPLISAEIQDGLQSNSGN